MYRIDGISVALSEELKKSDVAKKAGVKEDRVKSFKIIKKAIDARKKHDVHYVYTVSCDISGKVTKFPKYEENEYSFPKGKKLSKRPLIVGCGPSGLFAGLMLARSGYKPILIERGADVDARHEIVKRFWEKGEFCAKTNVQFGEGGAGTFSDGKLNSGINDERCAFVLKTFAEFGADDSITYIAKPHIGTDVLAAVVKNIRHEIEHLGGEVRFFNKLTKIIVKNEAVEGCIIDAPNGSYEIEIDNVILAIGHSARDTYEMLRTENVPMEKKNFSVGVRIEHSQEMINKSQYGDFYEMLPAADYKLSVHFENGRSAYTFCMCPGGYVVASASEEGTCVTNGMSYSDRSGKNSNSAVLVSVTPDDFPGDDVLSGVEFQREIERKAYIMGGENYNAPAQYVGDFLGTKVYDRVEPTYQPDVRFCDLHELFPEFVTDTLKPAILEFDKKLKGFASGGAVMTAPETRSSSPVRILRDKESLSSRIKGLYPCGEGAGYAGGIMSAAVDGIRVAEALIKE